MAKKINIRPTSSVYATYKRLSYQPWTAIAEFVDNSTQSFYDHRENPFAVKNCAAVNKEKRFFRNLLPEYILSAIIQETIWIGVERMRNTSC